MTNSIELTGISKSYGNLTALGKVDLTVKRNEILTLLGPSGCGKTTLMRIIAGFEEPTTGKVVIDGKDSTALAPEHRPVNMVFQKYALFPHLDVFDNVAFGLRLKKKPRDEIKREVTKALELVQLENFKNRWISELSGGQAQRVALARALVNRPAVLLLDEPLAALDLKIRHHMLNEIKRIHEETSTTFVYVTHDQDEAMILSDRVVLLNKGGIERSVDHKRCTGRRARCSPRNFSATPISSTAPMDWVIPAVVMSSYRSDATHTRPRTA